jgi:hypothetical protein
VLALMRRWRQGALADHELSDRMTLALREYIAALAIEHNDTLALLGRLSTRH